MGTLRRKSDILTIMIITWLVCLFVIESNAYKIQRYEFFMPNARPTPEAYLCSPVKIDSSRPYYVVGFEPKVDRNIVHHMLLYGCLEPGSSKSIWNCGEMSINGRRRNDYTNNDENEIDADDENSMEIAAPCKSNSSIIYAWAKDAPMLKLPKDVGFKIGIGATIRYLVLQIHYGHVMERSAVTTAEDQTIGRIRDETGNDRSGVYLHYTERPMKKLAGVLLLGTDGSILPVSTESFETACNLTERKVLHPFAFRTHTHALGIQVSGYRVRKIDGVDHWTLLGRRNPQLPQMFYPIVNDIRLEYGDYVAASCKMVNPRNRMTYIGSTAEDEMCNFYLMYWTEEDAPLQMTYCFTRGPPYYYWKQQFNNIPLSEEIIGDQLKF